MQDFCFLPREEGALNSCRSIYLASVLRLGYFLFLRKYFIKEKWENFMGVDKISQ